MIQLVFAHNGYNFGSKTGMPWPHISKDFQNFKKRTENTTLVMGAKTFQSLPCILPGRKHIVVCDKSRTLPLTRKGESSHQYISINDFEILLRNNRDTDKIYSVIGGKGILETALPYADRIVKTSIKLKNVHPDRIIPCNQWLTPVFLDLIENMVVCEKNHDIINESTEITEVVYEPHL